MADISANEIILAGIGFLLVAILTPIAMGTLVSTSTTSWNAAVVTLFQVLLPTLYMIGIGMHFIPKITGKKGK